jgi:hypothetical protein
MAVLKSLTFTTIPTPGGNPVLDRRRETTEKMVQSGASALRTAGTNHPWRHLLASPPAGRRAHDTCNDVGLSVDLECPKVPRFDPQAVHGESDIPNIVKAS